MVGTRWTGEAGRRLALSVADGESPVERARAAELLRPAPAQGRSGGPDPHLISLLAPDSFEAEQYRALRHVLETLKRRSDFGVLAITSAAAGEGKTTTAINLAGALAQAPEARVLLVDADLRLPSVAQQIGIRESAPGLADAILDPVAPLDAVVQRLPEFNLSVITAGRRPLSPYETLESPRLGEILAEARRSYDLLVVDSPPLIPVPDGRILSRLVDGLLLVVAAHKTPRRLVEEALDLLEPEKVVGLVLNGDDRPFAGYYGAYYGYGRARGDRRGRVARRREES
jgi:capsular exopolysaccharide synthesis family protein